MTYIYLAIIPDFRLLCIKMGLLKLMVKDKDEGSYTIRPNSHPMLLHKLSLNKQLSNIYE